MTGVTFINRMSLGQGKGSIMHREPGWFPSWPGCMALHAISRDISRKVIGIGCGVIICLMAGVAIG